MIQKTTFRAKLSFIRFSALFGSRKLLIFHEKHDFLLTIWPFQHCTFKSSKMHINRKVRTISPWYSSSVNQYGKNVQKMSFKGGRMWQKRQKSTQIVTVAHIYQVEYPYMTKSYLHKGKLIWFTAIYYTEGQLESENRPKNREPFFSKFLPSVSPLKGGPHMALFRNSQKVTIAPRPHCVFLVEE